MITQKTIQLTACAVVAAITSTSTVMAQDVFGADGFDNRPFSVSMEVRQGYDTNTRTTADGNKQESAFTTGSLTLGTVLGARRTRLSADLTGGLRYNWDGDQDDDYNIRLALSLTHNVNRRLSLALTTYTTYQIEPDFYDSLTLSRRSGHYFYSNSSLRATYQWTNKFSTITSYSLAAVMYEDSAVGAIEDRLENIFSQEFRYLILPTTVLVGEYRFAMVRYDVNDRDSDSHFFLAGVDHNFTPRLRASLRGGVEIRDYDSGAETSPYGEGTLTYNYGKGSSLRWINRYGYEQSDLRGNSATNLTFRSGLYAKQRLTARIFADLGIYYQNTKLEGRENGDVTDDVIGANAGLSYEINRRFSVNAGYNFTTISSDDAVREYDRHMVYAGFQASF